MAIWFYFLYFDFMLFLLPPFDIHRSRSLVFDSARFYFTYVMTCVVLVYSVSEFIRFFVVSSHVAILDDSTTSYLSFYLLVNGSICLYSII